MFIWIFYIFRATLCSYSGGLTRLTRIQQSICTDPWRWNRSCV